jgi:transposase
MTARKTPEQATDEEIIQMLQEGCTGKKPDGTSYTAAELREMVEAHQKIQIEEHQKWRLRVWLTR